MPMPSLQSLKDDPVSIMPANCSLRIIFHNEPLRPFSGLLQMHRRVLMSDPRPATSSMILPDRKSDGLKGSIFKSVLRLRRSLTDFAPRDKVAGGMSHAVITNLPRSTSLFKSRNISCVVLGLPFRTQRLSTRRTSQSAKLSWNPVTLPSFLILFSSSPDRSSALTWATRIAPCMER
jgi:hypothetical protein